MDEKTDIGPLKQVKRDIPFTVPEGYFEQFQGRLDQAIRHTKPAPRKVYIKPYLAAASIVAVALLAATMVFRHQYRQHLANRFHAEISRTVEMELYSISEETIMETMDPGSPAENGMSVSGDEVEMIDYLLNENIDEGDLLNSH